MWLCLARGLVPTDAQHTLLVPVPRPQGDHPIIFSQCGEFLVHAAATFCDPNVTAEI